MFILYVGCVSYIYIYIQYNSCIFCFSKITKTSPKKTTNDVVVRSRSRCITERLREQSSALDWSEGGRLDPVGAMVETPPEPGKKGLNKGYS